MTGNRTILATTSVLAAAILSLLPWRLIAQPSFNVPPTGTGAQPLPESYAKWLKDTPARPSDLAKWLEGKEVVEVSFSGPWMELPKLRDAVQSWSGGTNFHLPMVTGEGGGTGGSFVEICTTAAPEQVRSLLALLAVLDAHGYHLDTAQCHIWSYPGDAGARRKARDLIPEILSAAATNITQALPSVTTRRPRPGQLAYDVPGNFPGTNIGSLMISEIGPGQTWKWESAAGVDRQFHLPHLSLMVMERYGPTRTFPEGSPQRAAIRNAIDKAVEPLLKLEPSPIIYPAPE
jgi:hypothetical protein